MYEYIPMTKKKKEFFTVAILSVLATALFCFSMQSVWPYPALWQAASVLLLVAVVMLVSKCLLRSFVYRVAPRRDAAEDAPPDFTVIECYGKRSTVVCRISIADIEEITPITQENKKQISEAAKGKPLYRYYSELSPQNAYQLTVQNGEEVFYLCIVADERLIEMLKMY